MTDFKLLMHHVLYRMGHEISVPCSKEIYLSQLYHDHFESEKENGVKAVQQLIWKDYFQQRAVNLLVHYTFWIWEVV